MQVVNKINVVIIWQVEIEDCEVGFMGGGFNQFMLQGFCFKYVYVVGFQCGVEKVLDSVFVFDNQNVNYNFLGSFFSLGGVFFGSVIWNEVLFLGWLLVEMVLLWMLMMV